MNENAKNERSFAVIATCKRNLRLIQRAAAVCERRDTNRLRIRELAYLFEKLYKLIVRLEALPPECSSFDDVLDEIMAMTVELTEAYEKARCVYPEEIGEFLIASPRKSLRGSYEECSGDYAKREASVH